MEANPSRCGCSTPDGRGPRPGLVGGLTIIAFGVLLLLREWGMLPVRVSAWDLWPLLLIAFGLKHGLSGRGIGRVVFALLVAGAGLLLLLRNLGIVDAAVLAYWPIFIIALGVAVLLQGGVFGGGIRGHRRATSSETTSADVLRRSVSMGGAQIKVDSKPFRGGEISLFMAGMELDLRQAELPPEGATLDLHCRMAGLEVRVPTGWRLAIDVAPRFGAVHDGTEAASGAAGGRSVLTVRGEVTLGAVEFKN